MSRGQIEDVIKGLKCWSTDEIASCDECPYSENAIDCVKEIVKDTVTLINRQRAELEVLRRLCKIGDKLYIIVEDERHSTGYSVEINKVTEVGERFIFFSGYYPPRDDVMEKIPIEDIGKDIFLDEEAFRKELERRRLGNDA